MMSTAVARARNERLAMLGSSRGGARARKRGLNERLAALGSSRGCARASGSSTIF